MRTKEMRELTREELEQRRLSLAEERFNLRMRKSFKDLENPLRLRELRREIARINTILREDDLNMRALAKSKTSILDDVKPVAKDKK